jgi:hypothetical protein
MKFAVMVSGREVYIVSLGLPNSNEKWYSFEGDISFHDVVFKTN